MIRRDDFIQRFASKGYTKKAAAFVLDDFVSTVVECLSEGETINFRGFGSFEIREIKDRLSVDCLTGERIMIPEHKIVKFVPCNRLKRIVKDGRIDD